MIRMVTYTTGFMRIVSLMQKLKAILYPYYKVMKNICNSVIFLSYFSF